MENDDTKSSAPKFIFVLAQSISPNAFFLKIFV